MSEPNVEEPAPRPSRTLCMTHNQPCQELPWGPITGGPLAVCEFETLPADVADQWDDRLWHAL